MINNDRLLNIRLASYFLGIPLLLGAIGFLAERHYQNNRPPTEYHTKTQLDEKILSYDPEEIQPLADHINSMRESGNFEEVKSYLSQLGAESPAKELAVMMAADGIDTSSIYEVQKSLDNSYERFVPESKGKKTLNDIDRAYISAAQQTLLSSKEGLLFYIGARAYAEATRDERWKKEMEERSRWDPAVRTYMQQNDGEPPSQEWLDRREGRNWEAVSEGPSKFPDPNRNVIKRKVTNSPYGTSIREYRMDGTPEQVQQKRYEVMQQDRNDQIEQNRRNMAPQIQRDAGKAAEAAANAARNAAGNAIKGIGDAINNAQKKKK